MFKPDPQLVPDLEWMLQSGQVDHDVLAEALVREHYPAVYQLFFQYSPDFDPQSDSSQLTQVNIYTDGYYWGNILLGNPHTSLCQRSPDGLRIAFVNLPYQPLTPASILKWFNLARHLAGVQTLSEYDLVVAEFAFAPDSRRIAAIGYWRSVDSSIAAIGYRRGEASPELLFINTDTQQWNFIPLGLAEAKSLVWKTDGTQLALIGRYPTMPKLVYLIVVDVASGDVVSSTITDPNTDNPASFSWFTKEWGVKFPVEMGGLEACAKPPR